MPVFHKLRGTRENSFSVGDGTASNKTISFQTNDATKPGIQWNNTLKCAESTDTSGVAYAVPRVREETKALPTTVGNYIEIGAFTLAASLFSFHVTLLATDGAANIVKEYIITAASATVAYTTVSPITDSGPAGGHDFELELGVAAGVATLRLRRTVGTAALSVRVRILVMGADTTTYAALSGTGVSAAVGAYGVGLISSLTDVTGEPIGFTSRTTSQLSWNSGDKSLSLAVKAPASEYVFYEDGGVRHAKSTTQTATLAAPAAGTWWFYFSNGTLTYANSLPASGFRSAFVAIVTLDASNNLVALGDERHGVVWPWSVHEYAHDTIGTRWESGLATGRIATGTGGADGDAQVYVGGGTVWDEDLEFVIVRSATPTNDFEQELGIVGTPGQFPILYRSGSGSDNWVKRAATNFPVFQNGAGERIVYNKNTAGTWSAAQISQNGNWAVAWLVATHSITEPVVSVMGQEDYASSNAASAAAFADLALGNLPYQEMKPIAKLIFRTSTGYANSIKAYISTVTDLRNAVSLPSGNFIATDHNSLTGRTSADCHPATAVGTSVTNFTGTLTSAETDVQLALDKIDDHDHLGLTVQGKLRPPAGTADANSAPVKFTSGTLNTIIENGTVEYDGTHVTVAAGGVRHQIDSDQVKYINANIAGGAGWTTLGSISVANDSSVLFKAMFAALDKTSNDAFAWEGWVHVKKIGAGAVTMVTDPTWVIISKPDALWDVRASVGATTVTFDAYGDAANASSWVCRVQGTSLGE